MSVKKTYDVFSDGNAKTVSCIIRGGALYPALTARACNSDVPEGVIFSDRAEGINRFFICTATDVYATAGGTQFVQLNKLAGTSPFMVEDVYEGKPRGVVINGENALTHNGKAFMCFKYGANLCCGVMHCGRLFGADGGDKYKICWSGEGGISDWNEKLNGAGSVVLDPGRGIVLDILEFGEKLIVVRKYGLTVLSMFGTPENFSVYLTDTDTDEIYKGTARVACGKLLFYTSSGLHSYDGNKIEKVMYRFSEDVYAPVCSAVFDGNYFLSCTSNYLGGRAVLCYSAADGESYLIDVQADAMCAAECVYVYNADGAFRLLEGGEYLYESACIDFGTCRRKTVTRMDISGGAAAAVLSNGKTARKMSFPSECRPRLCGKSFNLRLKGENPVNGVTLTAEAANAI